MSANSAPSSGGFDEVQAKRPEKWGMGILNDRETDEVPGSCTSDLSLRVSAASQQRTAKEYADFDPRLCPPNGFVDAQ